MEGFIRNIPPQSSMKKGHFVYNTFTEETLMEGFIRNTPPPSSMKKGHFGHNTITEETLNVKFINAFLQLYNQL